jgi:hypothetical protein
MSAFSKMKIFPMKKTIPNSNLLGNGSVTIADTVQVRFSVRKGPKGPFATFAAQKGKKPDAQGKDIWYPEVKIVDDKLYSEFQTLVRTEYDKALGLSGQVNAKSKDTGEESQYNDGLPF